MPKGDPLNNRELICRKMPAHGRSRRYSRSLSPRRSRRYSRSRSGVSGRYSRSGSRSPRRSRRYTRSRSNSGGNRRYARSWSQSLRHSRPITLAQDPVQVKPAATQGRSLDYLAPLDLDPEVVVGLGPEEEGGAAAFQNHRTWGKCNLREKWAPKKLLIRRAFSISQSTCAYLGIMPFSSMCELAVRSV